MSEAIEAGHPQGAPVRHGDPSTGSGQAPPGEVCPRRTSPPSPLSAGGEGEAAPEGRVWYEVMSVRVRREGVGLGIRAETINEGIEYRRAEAASYEAAELHAEEGCGSRVLAVLTQVVRRATGQRDEVVWQAVWPEIGGAV